MEKPRILLISARSDLGGGPKYLLEFAKAISAQIDIFIASPIDEPFGPVFQNISKAHFELGHRSFNPATFFQLLFWLKKNKIATIHSHGRGAGIYSRLLKPFGFKVIHSFHGVHQEPSLSGKIKFWLDRLLAPLTDHFIFASQSELNSALNAGFKAIDQSPILHPIVNAPPFEMKPRKYQNPIRFGSIARLDAAKGIDQLLMHLSFFKKQHPEINWTYTHAGFGDQVINIPENIQAQVNFIGKIENPYLFLNEIDLYLACSRNEAFNISVLEALNARLPCLISNVPGHEFFIEAGVVTGFKQDDSGKFSEELLKLTQSSDLPCKYDDFLELMRHENQQGKYTSLILQLMSSGIDSNHKAI